MKHAVVLLALFAVFCGSVAVAQEAMAQNRVYKGEVTIPKKLHVEGTPRKFSYVFDQSKEGRGLLKIFAAGYYYSAFVSDWDKGILGPTSYRLGQSYKWRVVVWREGKPARELDAAAVERIKLFMCLIKPRIMEQNKGEKTDE